MILERLGDLELTMILEQGRSQASKWIYIWIAHPDNIIYFGVGPFPSEEAAFFAAEKAIAEHRVEREDPNEEFRYVTVPLFDE